MKLKKTLSLVISLVLLFSFTSCNNTSKKTNKQNNNVSNNENLSDNKDKTDSKKNKKEDVVKLDYALFSKDADLYYYGFNSKEPLKIVDNDVSKQELETQYLNMDELFAITSLLSENQKRLFFLKDCLNFGEAGTLMYVDILDNKDISEPKLIEEKVISYNVSKDANIVTFRSEKEGQELCQYNIDNQEMEIISSQIGYYDVSDDGKKILYNDINDILYEKEYKKEAVKTNLKNVYFSMIYDSNKYYYTKDKVLYEKFFGEKEKEIAYNVVSFINSYDTGEIYYEVEKDSKASLDLGNMINDDLKKSDLNLEYVEYPTYPFRENYNSDEAYYKDLDKYNIESKKALEFNKMTIRDEYRDKLSKFEDFNIEKYSIYYYDGKQTASIADWGLQNYNFASISYHNENPMVVFQVSEFEDKKVNISSLGDYFDLTGFIRAVLMQNAKTYLAIGKDVKPIDDSILEKPQNTNFVFSKRADKLYAINNKLLDSGESTNTLYEVNLKDKNMKMSLYDENIMGTVYAFENGDVVYERITQQDSIGSVWRNKEKLLDNAYIIWQDESKNEFICLTYNEDPLKAKMIYYKDKNEGIEVSQNAAPFAIVTENGNIVFIENAKENMSGDIYTYTKDGKKEIIIKDASIAYSWGEGMNM